MSRLEVHVQVLERIGTLDNNRGGLTLVEDLKQLKDKNENVLVLLLDELINEHRDDVELDDLVNTVSELGQVNDGLECVRSDLLDLIVEQLADARDHLVLNEDSATLLGASNLDDGARAELSDHIVILLEAVDQLIEDLGRLQSQVELVTLVEVLIDLHKNLGAQHVVVSFHLSRHFVYSKNSMVSTHYHSQCHLPYFLLP